MNVETGTRYQMLAIVRVPAYAMGADPLRSVVELFEDLGFKTVRASLPAPSVDLPAVGFPDWLAVVEGTWGQGAASLHDTMRDVSIVRASALMSSSDTVSPIPPNPNPPKSPAPPSVVDAPKPTVSPALSLSSLGVIGVAFACIAWAVWRYAHD